MVWTEIERILLWTVHLDTATKRIGARVYYYSLKEKKKGKRWIIVAVRVEGLLFA